MTASRYSTSSPPVTPLPQAPNRDPPYGASRPASPTAKAEHQQVGPPLPSQALRQKQACGNQTCRTHCLDPSTAHPAPRSGANTPLCSLLDLTEFIPKNSKLYAQAAALAQMKSPSPSPERSLTQEWRNPEFTMPLSLSSPSPPPHIARYVRVVVLPPSLLPHPPSPPALSSCNRTPASLAPDRRVFAIEQRAVLVYWSDAGPAEVWREKNAKKNLPLRLRCRLSPQSLFSPRRYYRRSTLILSSVTYSMLLSWAPILPHTALP
ncbi:hypothetical protein C8R46DRAFT_1209176 [Mycena filopes]|nr:hypothetical protein C8R46DRAFT_1209176 [Mycena filopes]